LRQRGQHRKAAELLDQSAAIAARTRRPHAHAILAVERGLLNLGAGQPERGLSELSAYRAASEASAPPIVEARLSAVQVRLLLSTGDVGRAEALVERAPSLSLCPDLAAARVQTAVACRDLDLAGSRLDDWVVDDAQPGHDAQRRLWTAVVALECGDRRRAIQVAAPVVDAAEREGDIAIFLDGGRPVERLLRAVLHAGPQAHATRALKAADRSHPRPGGDSLGLSRRELEVVRYLPTSLSSAEIAERLYISLNTLKTHLRTIYSKLGATNRREAIERAKDLGLA
jgi:LuxR family maltose regulon positive regulatory protein